MVKRMFDDLSEVFWFGHWLIYRVNLIFFDSQNSIVSGMQKLKTGLEEFYKTMDSSDSFLGGGF